MLLLHALHCKRHHVYTRCEVLVSMCITLAWLDAFILEGVNLSLLPLSCLGSVTER